MKLKMYKHLKYSFISITAILIVILSTLLLKVIKYPVVEEKNVSVFSYNNNTDINYQVFLKPNILYDYQSIEEGNIYLSEFVDHIKLFFKYKFSGEQPAEINGNYEIIASVEGYSSEEKSSAAKSSKTIWKKDFPLYPKTNFDTKENSLSITRDVSFKLNEYNAFAKQVIENSKVNVPVKLTVCVNINLHANTDKGSIQESFSPSIVLPLNTSYFEISKNEEKEKKGAIEETTTVRLPADRQTVILYSALLFIAALALLYLLIFTSGTKKTDPFLKNLNKIFKLHGSRLVALSGEISVSYDKYCYVRSMDDLVRIADELEKPIMYQYSDDSKNITQFYVFEDKWMYVFDLEKLTGPAEDAGLHPEEKSIADQPQQNATLAP